MKNKYKKYTGLDSNLYDDLNSQQYCEKCKKISKHPKIEVTDTIGLETSEANVYCEYCGESVNFWAYGHFQKTENGIWL